MREDVSFEVIEKSGDHMKFKVVNNDKSVFVPLIEELARDKEVTEVRYHQKHPFLDDPVVYIQVKSGKPQSALKRALKKIEKSYEELEKSLQKELKRLNESVGK